MSPHDSRRALQISIAIAGLVPVGAGLAGVLMGPALAGLGAHDAAHLAPVSLDSHFRYLSGLLLGIGILFWWAVPSIERRGMLVRALTLIVVIGGLGRALSLVELGEPGSTGMRLALIMELLITPLICLWQHRVEVRMGSGPRPRAGFFTASSRLS
jgi:hypothetical protein